MRYRYPNAPADALVDVYARRGFGLVAVVGPNGSGKSTLARLLAGRRAPTGGELERPRPVGLGHRRRDCGSVFERPGGAGASESGCATISYGDCPTRCARRVDVGASLDRVGLRALADRETSTLSGGELQRLAIAAALAREPKLLISDESTAMVDATGRAQLVTLFDDLAHRDGLGVVHVTHRAAEAAVADRLITLVADALPTHPARGALTTPLPPPERRPACDHAGAPLITLVGVGHVYSRNTPWATRGSPTSISRFALR